MKKPIFCTAGDSPALHAAALQLRSWGYDTTATPENATHLLLPVPTPADVLPPALPEDITVFCGNRQIPHAHCVDLLQDAYYLAENAAITASCAIALLTEQTVLAGKRILIIGWGRIGKCLAAQLAKLDAKVTLAARKETDRAMLQALGIPSIPTPIMDAKDYDIILNTAPAAVLDEATARKDAILMDLASVKGISGDRVQWARGLPGKMAPEASGALIAKTVLRYALGKE